MPIALLLVERHVVSSANATYVGCLWRNQTGEIFTREASVREASVSEASVSEASVSEASTRGASFSSHILCFFSDVCACVRACVRA